MAGFSKTVASATMAICMTLATAAPAAAAEWKWSDLYIGAALGQSDFRSACSGVSFCDHTDTAWKVFGGYRINEYVTAEVAYQDFGEASIHGSTLKGRAAELVAVGAYPLADRFAVYGKAGVYDGRLEAPDASKTKAGATFGVGVRYDVDANWAVRTGWQRYDGIGGSNVVKTDVDVWGAEAVYRFK